MTERRSGRARWVLGVDSGGSGLRVALAPVESPVMDPCGGDAIVSGGPVRTGPAGIDAGVLLVRLVPLGPAQLGRGGAPPREARARGAG
ncbi:ATPase, partial [Streptomyces sp. NPDC127084]